MFKRILTASPQTAFGELLRLSLEKGAAYRVSLARNGSEVLTAISHENYDLAILDGDLKDQPFLPLIQNLRVQQPQMRIIVIPQVSGNTRDSLKSVSIDGYLEKPININDLMQLVKELTTDYGDLPEKLVLPRVPRTVIKNPVETKWIEEHDSFQQNLFQLASRSVAQAVFVMRGQLVWAQASRENAVYNHQVIDLFLRAWDGKSNMDLVKVFRETREKPTWLMYATSLIENYILVMIFDARIPMREIRGHVIRMANGLSDVSLFESHQDEETGFFNSLKDIDAIPIGQLEHAENPAPANQNDQRTPVKTIICVFAPRDQQVRLVGGLKDSIKTWLPGICERHHWQLVELNIRPDHLRSIISFTEPEDKNTIPGVVQKELSEMTNNYLPKYSGSENFWISNNEGQSQSKVSSGNDKQPGWNQPHAGGS